MLRTNSSPAWLDDFCGAKKDVGPLMFASEVSFFIALLLKRDSRDGDEYELRNCSSRDSV